MPVAEAIEAGTPVVCSDIEPLVEVGGEAVVTCDPNDPESIADKVISVLQNDKVREKSLRRGIEQQKRFSGEAIALQTYNLYRRSCDLDPLEEARLPTNEGSRCESTRHWGRVCERNFKGGRPLRGLGALVITAWLSLPLAKAIWRALRKERTRIQSNFYGRYGDGWIGPKYRDWFMVPKGSKGFELELGAPPLPHADDFEIRIAVEGSELGVFRFDDDSTLRIPIDLKQITRELIRLEIDANRSFTPNEQVSNGDERELALKLIGIRWS